MNVLFINSKITECGVYQYGKRVSDILKTDNRFQFTNIDIDNSDVFEYVISTTNPDVIIYNWHTSTMPWLTPDKTHKLKHKKQLYIFHESYLPYQLNLHADGYFATDMSCDLANKVFPLLRPTFAFSLEKQTSEIPIIGSFGFGFKNKGFEKICSYVSQTFKEAIIKLHITNPFYGDYTGRTTNDIIEQCRRSVSNPNVAVEFTTNFVSDLEILTFLNSNSLNVFLYDNMPGRGLSSVIDYAVSVDTPLAVNDSYMFRHIIKETPEISVTNSSLKQILEQGTRCVKHYKEQWSHDKFKDVFYQTLTTL
jgi:hypothetical protein